MSLPRGLAHDSLHAVVEYTCTISNRIIQEVAVAASKMENTAFSK